MALSLVSGCGDDSPSTGGAKADVPGSNDRGASKNAFCDALQAQVNGFAAVFPKDFSNKEQLMKYGAYLKTSNATLTDTAPPDISADVRFQVGVSNAGAESFSKGNQPTAAVTKQLRSAEYLTAAKKVSAYAKTNCGISGSPPPG